MSTPSGENSWIFKFNIFFTLDDLFVTTQVDRLKVEGF